MRRISLGLLGIVLAFGCQRGPKPEEYVRDYASDFVRFASQNQLDSISETYPEILKADSILTVYEVDSIRVIPCDVPNEYRVHLAPDAALLVTIDSLNNVRVAKSQGVFRFDNRKMELARKSGQWNDSVSDMELSERLKDENFPKYLGNLAQEKAKGVLSISKFTGSLDQSRQTVTNNSDQTIQGSDYNVVKTFQMGGDFFTGPRTTYTNVPGKTLNPGESMSIGIMVAAKGQEFVSGIKWNLSDEELAEKFLTFTGNEYDDYLNSQKEN